MTSVTSQSSVIVSLTPPSLSLLTTNHALNQQDKRAAKRKDSPSGKIDAHVTTPAMPPQSRTVAGESATETLVLGVVVEEEEEEEAKARLQSS